MINKNIMKHYRIYLLLLFTVCMNPSVHSSDRFQNIPAQVTSSAHLFNSSSDEIKEQNQMNSLPVINSQYNDSQKNDYTLQNTATSSSEDDDSSWGLPPLNSSESDSSRCLLDELRAIFESGSPKREDNISKNSSFSTSRFMISTPVEENPLDNTAPETNSSETKNNIVLSSNIASTANSSSNKMEEESSETNSSQKRKLNNVSTASSLKKRKRKMKLNRSISQKNPSLDFSNSTLSSMEKEARYKEMLTVTRTECRAVLNPEKKYDEYDDRNFFKAFFSGLFLNVKRDCSNKYNPKQIKICLCILQSLGYSSREIALYGKIDGYLGLGYLPPLSHTAFETALKGLNLTKGELTLVENHLSRHQNLKKPKIGGIYQKYNSIFTKRRAHSK